MASLRSDQLRDHRIGAEPAEGLPVTPDAQEYVGDVPEEDCRGKLAAKKRCTLPVTRGPPNRWLMIGAQAVSAIEQRHAGEHQHDDADGEAQMRDAPDRRPAPVVDDRLAVAVLERLGAHVRPALVLLVVAIFAEEPQRRMRPEEREGAAEQQQHELRGDPRARIAIEVVVVGVRLEVQEARGRVEMALLAGLQAVGRIDASSADR